VFTRYVLNASPSWTEPASVMIMSWFIFLGAAVGVRENFHMGFDVLVHFLPARATPWMRAISDTAVLVFGIGMVVYGLQLTIDTWTATLPVLGLPGGFTYMPLAAGGLLITIFALERLVLRAAGVIVDHDPNAEDIMLSEA
jgi:TRAP-type C4-dicarboxylate transport system permease small subunit